MTPAVLIVDDSLTVRMDLAEAFEAAGLRPVLCADGREAREALRRETLSLVVLDVVLPDADGVDLLREIREDPRTASLPVLMLSSEAEVKDRVRGLRTGADDYVGKPYDAGYVIARGRELVRRKNGEAAVAKQTVLIIDDSETFRQVLTEALDGAGYAVLAAPNGEEGLRVAAATRPAAIIVDGFMPGIDGITVIRRIRLDIALSGTPCVLLTGSEDFQAELRALDAGADVFVRKEEDVDVILARLAAAIRSAGNGRAEVAASLVGPRRVLAVDDSETYLQEIASRLRGEGYDVALARSGEEALQLLAVQPVDCVLLDLLMPGMDGKETCKRLKTSPVRDIPVIMLTALEDRTAMIEGLGTGADDYISKASEFDVLKARVQAQIRRKQFEDENRRIREELLRSELIALEERHARQVAEARASLVEELERKNEELEAFSYSVSHDLRAPLRGINGLSHIVLQDYADRLDDKGRDYLRRIRASAEKMSDIIDDLLLLSRVSLAEIKREPVDLSQIARSVADDLERRDPSRHVELRIRPSVVVDADGRLMRVLLTNLVENAWKFTSKTEGAAIELGAEDQGDERVVFVRDNGAGFDMTYASKLFHPFQRLHGDAEFPGTGIGLATVRRILERHGGRVWAESAIGHGTTLYFALRPAGRLDGE